MNKEVYYSHSYSGNQALIAKIRIWLKNQGFDIIEHTGTWTKESMQKFLNTEFRLILPLEDYTLGRGQTEMVHECLIKKLPVYVITFCKIEDNEINTISIAPIIQLDYTFDDMKTNWSVIEFGEIHLIESPLQKLKNIQIDSDNAIIKAVIIKKKMKQSRSKGL